ncbi:hypothetical protein [Vibrio sp. Sgm 5]|uniref:hypothetical protein n=1 Tax=Vibrio sp. Sgm 5 TaxID=2994387 RepID=UPI0022496B57|nr:hypothetical protein [Vibrio sp. Sgm 5]MCX2791471.1 hypothetical protein [Vibrio sp. Sgm 5]
MALFEFSNIKNKRIAPLLLSPFLSLQVSASVDTIEIPTLFQSGLVEVGQKMTGSINGSMGLNLYSKSGERNNYYWVDAVSKEKLASGILYSLQAEDAGKQISLCLDSLCSSPVYVNTSTRLRAANDLIDYQDWWSVSQTVQDNVVLSADSDIGITVDFSYIGPTGDDEEGSKVGVGLWLSLIQDKVDNKVIATQVSEGTNTPDLSGKKVDVQAYYELRNLNLAAVNVVEICEDVYFDVGNTTWNACTTRIVAESDCDPYCRPPTKQQFDVLFPSTSFKHEEDVWNADKTAKKTYTAAPSFEGDEHLLNSYCKALGGKISALSAADMQTLVNEDMDEIDATWPGETGYWSSNHIESGFAVTGGWGEVTMLSDDLSVQKAPRSFYKGYYICKKNTD